MTDNTAKLKCGHDARALTTCGECGRSWCAMCTPTPAARCPFEYDHDESDDDGQAVAITLPADLDPDALIVLPEIFANMPGAQTDDGVTAVALIDLARQIVADYDDEEAGR